jgi:alpha-1,2-mannosyltransferase
LSLNAVAALLISPVSWSHHWAWCAPVMVTLVLTGRRYRARLPQAVAVAGLALFVAAPQLWFLSGSTATSAWQQAARSSYIFLGSLILLLGACWKLPLHASLYWTNVWTYVWNNHRGDSTAAHESAG